jgi:RIO kinase 1
MVKVWAEKELRNLRRLEQAGIRAPRVVEGKENVLVMEFLGVDDTYVIKNGLAHSTGLLQG